MVCLIDFGLILMDLLSLVIVILRGYCLVLVVCMLLRLLGFGVAIIPTFGCLFVILRDCVGLVDLIVCLLI